MPIFFFTRTSWFLLFLLLYIDVFLSKRFISLSTGTEYKSLYKGTAFISLYNGTTFISLYNGTTFLFYFSRFEIYLIKHILFNSYIDHLLYFFLLNNFHLYITDACLFFSRSLNNVCFIHPLTIILCLFFCKTLTCRNFKLLLTLL